MNISFLTCMVMLFACLFSSFPANAGAPAEKPAMTQTVYIAMLYKKLLHQEPEFEAWAESMPEYKSAELYERGDIMRRNLTDIKNTFKLLSPAEPVILNTMSPLGAYDTRTKSLLIKDFHELTFFSYSYDGEDYAIIPHDIKNYRWIKVSPALADIIWKESAQGKKINVQLTLQPRSADAEPIYLMGKSYHLLMMDVFKIDLWSGDGRRLLWSSIYNSPAGNDLLTLHH